MDPGKTCQTFSKSYCKHLNHPCFQQQRTEVSDWLKSRWEAIDRHGPEQLASPDSSIFIHTNKYLMKTFPKHLSKQHCNIPWARYNLIMLNIVWWIISHNTDFGRQGTLFTVSTGRNMLWMRHTYLQISLPYWKASPLVVLSGMWKRKLTVTSHLWTSSKMLNFTSRAVLRALRHVQSN